MAGPSTLPGPLGQVDRIHYGTRLNVFWYGEAENSKKAQNDLSIDLKKGSNWYRTIVVNHPVERTVSDQRTKIVVLADIDQRTNHPDHGIWIDALSDATYGDDFCGGKMWHFTGDFNIDALDSEKEKRNVADLSVDKVGAYLGSRNKAWEMYPKFEDVFSAGSQAPSIVWPPPHGGPSAFFPPFFSPPVPPPPAPIAYSPLPPAPAPALSNKDSGGTEFLDIALLAQTIRQIVYNNGDAIKKSTTRRCTRCIFEKPKDTDISEIKYGVMVPTCLLGDRNYFGESQIIFRSSSIKDPSIYNGFSVCSACASKSSSKVHFMKIDETNKICIICLTSTRCTATMMCKPCGEQVSIGKDESIVMDYLLGMIYPMFPHYKISLPSRGQAKFDICEYKIDYSFDAEYYDGISKTWKKIKFLFELDQRSHAGYDLWDEKTRLVRVLRGTLETHGKVVMLRLNHTDAFAYPPGFSDATSPLEQPNFHERFLVLRHWVLYFLQNMPDLPPATLLYLYYRYQTAYDTKYGKDMNERVALTQEDDITDKTRATPTGQERLPPLWKNACTGFAFSSPPVRTDPTRVNWKYYVTNGEYKDCNESNVGPTLVGKMQAACERTKYQPFPLGLRSDMHKFPSMDSPDEAFATKKSGKKTKRA
jgi:hypothetical protein